MTTANPGHRLGLLGRKVGMMRIFTDDGDAVPVTVLDVSNNRVTQIKTEETDGYSAVQVAFGTRKASRVTKPEAGHLAKAGVEAGEILQEFRVEAAVASEYQPGGTLPVSLFAVGQLVDVQGTSIGKGFTGTIKRHNFSSQRASHGNSRSHNVPGSISMAQDPGRVFPGKKMTGHMGDETVTTQNLDVIRIDEARQLLLVRGAVLLGTGALARVGLVGDDDLVDQRLVVVAAEHGVRRVDLGRGLALLVEELELHQFAPFLALTLTAGRTVTKPFFAPGTAPRTSSSWRASSMRSGQSATSRAARGR